MIGMPTLPQMRRARSITSLCVSRPRSGSPMQVAETAYPETNASSNPARSASFDDSVS